MKQSSSLRRVARCSNYCPASPLLARRSAQSCSPSAVGPIAEATRARLNLDVAILGVDGESAKAGLTTHHEVEARTNWAILNAAERVIVVAG
jgi:DeoR family transcriptional regulator, aga operon transcriptional repressor